MTHIPYSKDWCLDQTGQSLIRHLPFMPEIVPVSGALLHRYPSELDHTIISGHQVPFLKKIPMKKDTAQVRFQMWHGEEHQVVIIPEIGILTCGAIRMMIEVRFLVKRCQLQAMNLKVSL